MDEIKSCHMVITTTARIGFIDKPMILTGYRGKNLSYKDIKILVNKTAAKTNDLGDQVKYTQASETQPKYVGGQTHTLYLHCLYLI